ncbi:uncharacterized protein C11orf71 homolog [Nannospalax galili]|uniref:uncharacterized protein C11orf71 homolog n=1 Tax=Nannospalax galili TaxID=1026970 RepID=UPI0004ED2D5C|nr:uncharacterized protein C11orf71 homolog [Nannospalax galili]
MAPNSMSSAGDQANMVAFRSTYGDLSRSALAWAILSRDSFLLTRPEPNQPGLWPPVRPTVPTDRRRVLGGGRSRSRQGRYSPYPIPEVKLDLLRSVLQQRLVALAARISA